MVAPPTFVLRASLKDEAACKTFDETLSKINQRGLKTVPKHKRPRTHQNQTERLFLVLFLVDVLLCGGFGRGRFWTLANFSWNAMK